MTYELRISSYPARANTLACRHVVQIYNGKFTPIKQPWSDTTSAEAWAMRHARRAPRASSQQTLLPLHITNAFVWAAAAPSDTVTTLSFCFLFSQVIQVNSYVSAGLKAGNVTHLPTIKTIRGAVTLKGLVFVGINPWNDVRKQFETNGLPSRTK